MKPNTAAEVDALERLFEQTAEEPAKKCMGGAGRACAAEAVVHVTWQTCVCGKSRVEVDYCMPCYDSYDTVIVGGRTVKEAQCSYACRIRLYSLRVRKA